MKVNMKQYEKWCQEYTERWNKKQSWDMYCVASDAWLNGYKKALEEARKLVYDYIQDDELFNEVKYLGADEMEVEVASNQIGVKNGNT